MTTCEEFNERHPVGGSVKFRLENGDEGISQTVEPAEDYEGVPSVWTRLCRQPVALRNIRSLVPESFEGLPHLYTQQATAARARQPDLLPVGFSVSPNREKPTEITVAPQTMGFPFGMRVFAERGLFRITEISINTPVLSIPVDAHAFDIPEAPLWHEDPSTYQGDTLRYVRFPEELMAAVSKTCPLRIVFKPIINLSVFPEFSGYVAFKLPPPFGTYPGRPGLPYGANGPWDPMAGSRR